EAEVLVQPVPDVVPVEDVSEPPHLHEGVFEGERGGALARARQAREPQGHALLFQQLLPRLAGDVALVPGDVRRFDVAHLGSFSSEGLGWGSGKKEEGREVAPQTPRPVYGATRRPARGSGVVTCGASSAPRSPGATSGRRPSRATRWLACRPSRRRGRRGTP